VTDKVVWSFDDQTGGFFERQAGGILNGSIRLAELTKDPESMNCQKRRYQE